MTIMSILGYITIGLFIGWLSRIITRERGVTMFPSLAFGVLGSLVGMAIVKVLGLSGAVFYSVVGAICILFTVNAFRQKEPIFTDKEAV